MKKQMAAMAMTLVMATGALAGCGKTVTTTTGSSTSTEQAGSETASTETAAASSNEAAATTEAPKEGVITAQVVDIDLTSEEYAFGVDKNQPELLEKTNEYIAKIMADGTFDEICMKYFGDGTPTPVVSAVEDPSKDQLLVATNAAFEPFEYMEGENYLGIVPK